MCCLFLVCAVLETLHLVKHILNEEECRSVGKASFWWNKLAVVIAVKPPGAVQETLGVLEEYKRDWQYDIEDWQYNSTEYCAKGIKSKLCLGISLCRHTSPHFLFYPPFTDCALYVVKMRQRLVTLTLTL